MSFFITISSIFIVIAICLLLVLQQIKLEKFRKEIKSIKKLNRELVHNIKSPLSAIKAGTDGIKDYLPSLLSSYDKAKNANLIDVEIMPQQLAALFLAVDHTLNAVQQAGNYIDKFSQHLKS